MLLLISDANILIDIELGEMVHSGKVSVQVARGAYRAMKDHGRRLPWDLAEQMLGRY